MSYVGATGLCSSEMNGLAHRASDEVALDAVQCASRERVPALIFIAEQSDDCSLAKARLALRRSVETSSNAPLAVAVCRALAAACERASR